MMADEADIDVDELVAVVGNGGGGEAPRPAFCRAAFSFTVA